MMYDEDIDKISEVIHYIANRIQGLTRTQMVKLLYLIDREFYRQNGKQMTNSNYYMYFHGPYCNEWELALAKLKSKKLIREKEIGMSFKIYFNRDLEYSLKDNEKELLDSILKCAKEKKLLESAKNIRDYVYTLEEVKNAKPDCKLTFEK